MIEKGAEIEMTKGYKGIRGTLIDKTESEYEFYIIVLQNGIRLVAGPTAFVLPAGNNGH